VLSEKSKKSATKGGKQSTNKKLFDKVKEDDEDMMDIDEEELKDAALYDLDNCLEGLTFVCSG